MSVSNVRDVVLDLCDFLRLSVRGGVGKDAFDADRFSGRGRAGGRTTGEESSEGGCADAARVVGAIENSAFKVVFLGRLLPLKINCLNEKI